MPADEVCTSVVVEGPWKRLRERYPYKAQLLMEMLWEPLDSYSARVVKKVLGAAGNRRKPPGPSHAGKVSAKIR